MDFSSSKVMIVKLFYSRSDPYNFDKNFIDVDNIKIEPVGQNSSSLMRDDVDL